MKQIEKLIDRVIARVNVNLRKFNFDAEPYAKNVIPFKQMLRFNAFYGVTSHHPLHVNFKNSSLAGSYFLGKCFTDNAVLYKTDVRGDELKRKGDTIVFQGVEVPVEKDEEIHIKDSYLIKTLIHNYSHDPESPEEFMIRNTLASFYSNIHGSMVEGCYIAPFATVDLTSLHGCKVGTFAYVQSSTDLYHHEIPDGTIWLKGDTFEFKYTYDSDVLERYIKNVPGGKPQGILWDFMESRKKDYSDIYGSTVSTTPMTFSSKSAINRYAYVAGDTHIDENVLVSQRAYLYDAWMGPGTNAQEHSYVINSRLEKNDITAHGAKIINSILGEKVFVGFNSFINGKPGMPVSIGSGSMVMPHTIIDVDEALVIPERHAVWGYIRNADDLKNNSVSLDDLSKVTGEVSMKNMTFSGSGFDFVDGFEKRIDHILEANGAYYSDSNKLRGHAQAGHMISFNTLQPYLTGKMKGIFPTIDIQP